MSVKSKLLASAATLTLVGGAGVGALATTAGAANAATPSCGSICLNIFSTDFPLDANGSPAFVIDDYKRGQTVGQPIILFRSSSQDPAEDFTYGEQGTVADFFAAGLVSASLDLHYGAGAHFPATNGSCAPLNEKPVNGQCLYPNLNAFELEYAPYGAESGLCMGLAATAVQGEKVSLEPCGVSSKTVWIEDDLDGLATHGGGIPLINGSDNNFSHPFVLTYPSGSYPTDMPRPQTYVSNLTGSSQGPGGILPVVGTVSDAQLWAYFPGILGG